MSKNPANDKQNSSDKADNKHNASDKEADPYAQQLDDALLAYQQGNFDKAIDIFEQIIINQPDHPLALHALGFLAFEQNDLDNAMVYLQRAVAADPQSAECQCHLANVYAALKNFSLAEQHYQQAIRLQPDYAEAYHNLGALYYKTGRRDEALRFYAKAVELQPDYADAHYSLGLYFIGQQQYDAALTQMLNVVNLYPGHIPGQYQLANLYLQQQDYEKALPHYHQVLRFQPEHLETLNNVGVILLHENKLEDALQYFFRIITFEPSHVEGRHNMAAVLMKLNRYAEAKEHYEYLLKQFPEDIDLHFNLGVVFLETGDFGAAIEQNNWVITRHPDHIGAQINQGVAYLKTENIDQALEHYQNALRLQPENQTVQYLVAALRGEERPQQAPRDYIKSLFDRYAHYYDRHLTETLHYHLPDQIRAELSTVIDLNQKKWTILDLGCGTGLSGEAFRDIARRLVGIDLSANMLAVAREKAIYDELIEGDLIQVLTELQNINVQDNSKAELSVQEQVVEKSSQMPKDNSAKDIQQENQLNDELASISTHKKMMAEKFDLILSADSLVYFGDLHPLISVCKQVLSTPGYFAFSTELLTNSDADYVLQNTGRYAHNAKYIVNVVEAAGYKVLLQQQVVLRTQQQHACPGLITIITNE